MAGFFQLIHGNSELLVNEHRLALINKAKRHGYDQIERVTIDPQFNWQELITNAHCQDLWSDKKVIDINNHINKLDRQATAALIELAELADKQLLVIVCCGKLTSAQTKAKWYQQLDTIGQCNQMRAPNASEYPSWLIKRANTLKITLDQQCAQQLAELTQGNLLAGQQALEKAQLLDMVALTSDKLDQVISDSAQYQVFDLGDALLQQKANTCLTMLNNLQQQNTEATLILWSLSQTCRQLLQMRIEVDKGASVQQVTSKQWASKRPLFQSALQKTTTKQLSQLMQQCHSIDLTIKSNQSAQCWQQFSSWILQFCQPKAVNA